MRGGNNRHRVPAHPRADGRPRLAGGLRIGAARQAHQLQRIGRKPGRKGQFQRRARLDIRPCLRGDHPLQGTARGRGQPLGHRAAIVQQQGNAALAGGQIRAGSGQETNLDRMGHRKGASGSGNEPTLAAPPVLDQSGLPRHSSPRANRRRRAFAARAPAV